MADEGGTPVPSPVVITDEMVDRAARYCDMAANGPQRAGHEATLEFWRQRMRGALQAAVRVGE